MMTGPVKEDFVGDQGVGYWPGHPALPGPGHPGHPQARGDGPGLTLPSSWVRGESCLTLCHPCVYLVTGPGVLGRPEFERILGVFSPGHLACGAWTPSDMRVRHLFQNRSQLGH